MTTTFILWLLGINAFAFFLYWHDKRQARTRGWRVPEAVLLLTGLLGGTPASFAAQRLFRHKTKKFSFQMSFWLIVAVQAYCIIRPPAALLAVLHTLAG